MPFASHQLNAGSADGSSSNVLLIIHDDTGHDERSAALNPRGILEATLLDSSPKASASTETTQPKSATGGFAHWRVAGTAGGSTTNTLDPVRGVYNEDGLFGERVGWHLPGFDDSDWADATSSGKSVSVSGSSCDEEEGGEGEGEGDVLIAPGGTVTFFRTVVPIFISSHAANHGKEKKEEGIDTTLTFHLHTPGGSSKAYRLQLFVNGYQYGRYNPHIGNQVEFPIPPGIVNFNGENTVGIAIWAQTTGEEEVRVQVGWGLEVVVGSSVDVSEVSRQAEGLRPAWSEVRERFG